jgi:type IV pilus assembly protein PilV
MKKTLQFQQGFSLVEVLATLLVVAFGFLAILKLQVQTMVDVADSNTRYVAANLAQDMGERLRANAENIGDYTMPDWGVKGDDCDNICVADINEWLLALQGVDALNDGEGKITIPTTSQIAEIEIRWSELNSSTKSVYSMEVPVNDKNI